MAARGLARLFLLVNLYQSFMPATGLTAGDLEFHLNGGWCESAGTVDDCTVDEVPCANGEDADAAAACWNLCEDKYPNQVEAVDIDDTEINAASSSNCMCCCQTKCDCVSDIRQVGGKSFAVPLESRLQRLYTGTDAATDDAAPDDGGGDCRGR